MSKKILVVVDMQNDFTSGVLGNAECEAAVSKVVDVINNGDYDYVYLTRDTHEENYLDTQEGKKLPIKHCIHRTEGWEIRKEILTAVDRKFKYNCIDIVDKCTFGSHVMMAEMQLTVDVDTEIHLCGVCTGICVLSNAVLIKNAFPENKVCVVENACACVTTETHKTAIEAMKTLQIDII